MLNKDVVIIGGGISGLTSAFEFKKNNFNFCLLESSSRIGGVIETEINKNFIFEKGPNTFLLSDKRILNFFNELNLDIIDASPTSNNRYVLKNKKCVKVPTSLIAFLLTPLFTMKTKLKIITEFLNKKKSIDDKESVSDFICRRFNKQLLEYAVNPFIAGTYAGDPDKLSIKHAFPMLYNFEKEYGSILKGLLNNKKSKTQIKRRSISFKNGLNEIIIKLNNILKTNIKLKSKVVSISKQNKLFSVSYLSNNTIKTITTKKIICTVPTYALKHIKFNNANNPFFNKLSSIYYPPIISVTIAFKKNKISKKIDGFGILIPKIEKMNILGILYLSSIFKNRAPKNSVLLTVFLGGSRQPQLINLNEKKILNLIKVDLNKIFNIKSDPFFICKKLWKQSIPQYNIGYDQYINCIKKFELKNTGFHFTGNFLNGISLQNNMINAITISKKIIDNYKHD